MGEQPGSIVPFQGGASSSVGRMITTIQRKEGSEVVGTRTQQSVEIPSPLLLAIKEWQRQLILKLK
jgi:hypothetical protein